MSILLGRPRLINAMDCDAEPPIDCDIPENLESMNLSTIKAHGSTNNGLPSSVCISLFMYSLSHIIHEIRTLGADKRGLKDYSIVQRLHSQILSLVEDLPPALRTPNPDVSWDLQFPILPRQREKIHTAAYSLLIALHRPHMAKHMQSRQRALQAALKVLESQQRYFEAISRMHYGYFGNAFYNIDAAIVLSTVVSVFPSKDIDMLRQIVLAIQQAIGRLCLIEPQNELAPSGIKILRSCYLRVNDGYNKSRHPDLILSSYSTSNPEHQDLLPELGDRANMSSLGFNDTFENQSDFPGPFTQMHQTIGNEFDTSYWMDYRQQVFSDAAHVLDGDGNWNELLGPIDQLSSWSEI